MLPECTLDSERGVFVNQAGRIWVPEKAQDLQQRLCVIAHTGSMGHRGEQATTTALSAEFEWKTLADDVKTFVRGCLHCMTIGGAACSPTIWAGVARVQAQRALTL